MTVAQYTCKRTCASSTLNNVKNLNRTLNHELAIADERFSAQHAAQSSYCDR